LTDAVSESQEPLLVTAPKGKQPADATEPDFEHAMAEIEAIVERIEGGEVGLEEALAQYERGVTLINQCRSRLGRAQRQVEDLTKRLEQADNEGSSGGTGER
jgi:exodeoxyribonuclease VII small subunit